MLLFLDTETTGLWHWKEPPDHPDQPHLVQLAALLCEQDGRRVREMNRTIIPYGWTIPHSATRIHRITTQQAAAFGNPLRDVLSEFAEEMYERLVPTNGTIIGHNVEFDLNVLRKAFKDAFMQEPFIPLTSLKSFCTMKTLAERMNLPGHKWPSLREAWHYTYPDRPPLEYRHSAMGDVLACHDIYLAGRDRGWW